MKKNNDIIVILGPTATNKTRIASLLAHKLNTQIISADSRQVYKNMDIGTGKDYDDYVVDGIKIPYHLIDIAEPGYKYNVFEFQRDFHSIFSKLKSQNLIPILCGGSGLYIDCILRNFDLRPVPQNDELRKQLKLKSLPQLKEMLMQYKQLHNPSDVDTVNRAVRAIEIAEFQKENALKPREYPDVNYICFGIDCERDARRKRISERLQRRVDEGMISEVEQLMQQGLSIDDLEFYGLEYKYTAGYLKGEYSLQQYHQLLEIAIHQFAKRQMTYFRSMEKKGISIQWISRDLTNEEIVDGMLNSITRNCSL